ncbi:hypothetical protein DY000_02062532 [Brassica cretica]|uniref:Bifunctional inhibitor/plant lipid transfer protein/seed storage helical domain-containing protein n=1 Tax=Brassica cretica TaxID=69181 RepID=A0ABQ7B3I0_BRACR|nr:hypothetical protein DY000_02062532 [Brassica cretica]
MEKLMSCQPYIHAVNPPPPPSCCGPMKEIVVNDAPCLCAVFNNPAILKTLNLTKENALDLPKACGANPDISLCSKTACKFLFLNSPAWIDDASFGVLTTNRANECLVNICIHYLI